MTGRELVTAALSHQETEIVPCYCDFTHQERDKMIAFMGEEKLKALLPDAIFGGEYAGEPRPIAGKPEHFQDDFGVIWDRSGVDKDIGVVANHVFPEPDMKYWHAPEVAAEKMRAVAKRVSEQAGDRFSFVGIGFSTFERYWTLCGMENGLAYMLTDPEFAADLFGAICDFNLKMIDIVLEYPVDAVYFGDDWGQQKGLIMGPALWRKFIKPCLAKMYGRVRQAGRFVIQHSCGDIEQVYGDLIEIGLHCHQTFQPEIYDIAAVKQKYGDKLAFWGGISTQRLLPYATPEEVTAEVKRIIRVMKPGGGYIASPTHAVPGDVPCENIVAMLKAFKNQ